MQAIITKHLGPTNTKDARIKATASGGSVTIPYSSNLEIKENHRKAAEALMIKMRWVGSLASGSTKTGMVFVFVE